MKLHTYLRPELVKVGLETRDVEDTLRELVSLISAQGLIQDAEAVLGALLDREAAQSTGIGGGVAIPHAVCAELESTVIALALSREGIDFRSLDEEPVHIFFLLLSPPANSSTHIKLLARIARLMRQPEFAAELVRAPSAGEALAYIRRFDEEHP